MKIRAVVDKVVTRDSGFKVSLEGFWVFCREDPPQSGHEIEGVVRTYWPRSSSDVSEDSRPRRPFFVLSSWSESI